MKIIYSKKCAEYFEKSEEESPNRVLKTADLLKKKYFEFLEPKKADEKDILRIHSKEFLEVLKKQDSKNPLVDSTFFYKDILDYAKISAGGAILAMEKCFEEKTFSLMRPPGHHAGKTIAGFCFLNNMAIAVKKALEDKKAEKVAIIDIDVHAGNGTQEMVLGDKRILFCSIHQSPLYPWTCLENQNNCFNYLVKKNTKEKEYLKKLEEVIKKVKEFNPDLIGVSAGFDTYKKDKIGKLKLEIETYKKIGQMIKSLDKPTFSILEGGYSNWLPECILSYIKGLQ
jgi:acetoin utilization deacetylase AcuC-like enzyme